MTDIISVSTLNDLYAALASAKGGETIALAGGNYGELTLNRKSGFPLDFPSNVTITSADPDDPAIFSRVRVDGASNLSFDSVTFDYTFSAGDQIYYRPFNFTNSENLAIRNSTFDGDLARGVSEIADGHGYAFGLGVSGSQSVILENNEIFNFHRGIVVGKSDDMLVRGNDIHSLRMDGMNFAQVRDVLIEENWIHDFNTAAGSGDHADMIQFWTNGTTEPTENVVIRNNILDIGTGGATQSIFMRNEEVDTGRAGEEMLYRNILIEENVIINGHLHGITVGETEGLIIRNNSVLHADGREVDGLDRAVEIPRINVKLDSTGVIITGNATAATTGHDSPPAGWVVSGNALVQDQRPLAPGYYGNEFITSSLTPGESPVAVKGGLLDSLGAGATITRSPGDGGLLPLFTAEVDPANMARVTFDASATLALSGPLPAGTEFLWTFGDGSTASGLIIAHAYATVGQYDVQLAVIPPGQGAEAAQTSVGISGTTLLALNGDTARAYDNIGGEILLPAGALNNNGLALGAEGTTLSVAREHALGLVGSDDFTINFTLQADSAASRGEIFRLHGTMIATVDAKGNLLFRGFADGLPEQKLTSSGVNLTDMQAHDISISARDGVLTITIDGTEAASAPLQSVLGGTTSNHGLTFGNPWGQTNFAGTLSDLELAVGQADFPPSSVSEVIVTVEETLTMGAPLSGFAAMETGLPFVGPALRMESSYEETVFTEEDMPADFLPAILPAI